MIFSFLRILTYVLALVGLTFLLPIAVALRSGETRLISAFLLPASAVWLAALVFHFVQRRHPREFDARNAFGVVGGIWLSVSLFGALPLYLSGYFPSFTDSFFESVSGFTTTGASILCDVEVLPRSINLWRCQTHALGGMGVIALAVALIPLLGVGGFRLIKAETTGPDKEKVTAFIANTAKSLWAIYFVLTLVLAIALKLSGLGYVDSLAHAFSTMGTGGFSTRNASLGAFANPAAEWIVGVFMLVASVNFALYYRMLCGRFREVWHDSELKAFVSLMLVSIGVGVALQCARVGWSGSAVRDVFFQLSSIVSTTGFMTADYLLWTPAAQIVLFSLFFVGGCSGSTAGGIKVIRWTILAKQFKNEFLRLLHPRQVFTLSVNGCPGRESFVPVVAVFIFSYCLLVLVTTFAGALAGLDPWTAFTAAASMVGNIGPAFGELGPTANYGSLLAPLKWWYAFAMLAGRLEIFTFLILLGRLTLMDRKIS